MVFRALVRWLTIGRFVCAGMNPSLKIIKVAGWELENKVWLQITSRHCIFGRESRKVYVFIGRFAN